MNKSTPKKIEIKKFMSLGLKSFALKALNQLFLCLSLQSVTLLSFEYESLL